MSNKCRKLLRRTMQRLIEKQEDFLSKRRLTAGTGLARPGPQGSQRQPQQRDAATNESSI